VATVAQITAAYGNYLLPVLPDQPGVCRVCGTNVIGDFPRCWQCSQAREALDQRADVILPIALALNLDPPTFEVLSASERENALTY
jgi:hypothetical protein